jgi:pyruvate dehydrogenase E2 component (dihydrolipoamide acetyltransferase)
VSGLTDVVLPNLGFGMTEGRVIRWLKAPGDPVRKGEPIAEIESDKATVELEAVVEGVLAEILTPADTVAAVDSVIARIGPAGMAAGTPTKTAGATPLAQRMAKAHGVDVAEIAGSGPGGRVMRSDVQAILAPPAPLGTGKPLAAPATRKLARDNGVDLRTVRGSGPDGIITRADVEAAIRRGQTAPTPAPTVAPTTPPPPAPIPAPMPTPPQPAAARPGAVNIPVTPMRAAIGRALTQSMQEAPHFYVTAELDFTRAAKALPQGVGITALILYLTVRALRDVPALNATYENGALYQYQHVNLSVAVALPDGLISPVLHHADDFSLTGLADRVNGMVARAREGRLKPEELSGGTFTVSNLGVIKQVDRFTAIIQPPQVGILAVGAAKDRPYVIDGGLHIRKTAHLTLSVDHRIVDGYTAGKFLEAFDAHLGQFSQNGN